MATTSIWADVVANVACDGLAEVVTIIPVGSDPHGYEPSLQDTERMTNASLVVANGLTLEGRLEDTLDVVAESGTPVLEFAEHMDPIPYESEAGHHDEHDEEGHDEHDEEGHDHDEEGHDDHDEHGHDDHDEHGHDDHDEEGHDHDEEGHDDHDEEGHDHGTEDPHVWLDPHRVAEALPVLAQALTTNVGLDPAAVEACLASYQA